MLRTDNAGRSVFDLADGHPDVWRRLNEVVDVKRTFGALVLAFLHRGVSGSGAESLAMRGLRDGRARAMAARMRDTWPLQGGAGARGGEREGETYE